MKQLSLTFAFVMFFVTQVLAQTKVYTLQNSRIKYTLVLDSGHLHSDTLQTLPKWIKRFGLRPTRFYSDADFSVNIFWTDWTAPYKIMNGDNQLRLTKRNFRFISANTHKSDTLTVLNILFQGPETIRLLMTYQLSDNAFFIRRKIKVLDTVYSKHFLQFLAPLDFTFPEYESSGNIKKGGFGQPIAFLIGSGGVFFGLEYPAGTQKVKHCLDRYIVKVYQEIGQRIDSNGISSAWAVMGITPNKFVKWWFYRYIDNIRVVPVRPYTLYNSWFDLRSPQYPGITPDHIMNQKNVMHIIDLIKKNMIDKYGIHLDAFVLDDGWDVYESDWKLNRKSFPNGLKPIADRLKAYGTVLGLWFGPTGGYSFRNKRINWMRAHGYEVTGNPVNWANQQLCLAGKNYSALFEKRITDFVKNDGVGYYKWDGIQFSCSDPTHGHPVGIYSRRAIMQSLIDKCNAVRALEPQIFLNITSGTWLSPWWVKYANTIWMQGWDYGYSDAPSISKRDAAMTYRDYVLYQDFVQDGFWFPIANLMTHGIIKGNLQKLGGQHEPLDKFTNNALLYFARGVSMYELYISPDILTDAEWRAIAQSLKWAKVNFDILKNSFFIGGNPARRRPYGYIHFAAKKGIVAVRNPFITKAQMYIQLNQAYGLESDANNLVIEQVYPYHQILPNLYSQGDSVEITLEGYQTAVYAVYPLEQATYPLITGAKFKIKQLSDNSVECTLYDLTEPKLLNKKIVSKITDTTGKQVKLNNITTSPYREHVETQFIPEDSTILFSFINPSAKHIQLALLYENKNKPTTLPTVLLVMNSDTLRPHITKQKGKWIWQTYDMDSDTCKGEIILSHAQPGIFQAYGIYDEILPQKKIIIKTKRPVKLKVFPPEIYDAGIVRKNFKIGEIVN